MSKIQPKPVQKIVCPKCGELQVKIYPYSTIHYRTEVPPCLKCLSKGEKMPVMRDKLGNIIR